MNCRAREWMVILALTTGMVVSAMLGWSAAATEPVISLIQFYSSNQVLIHFDTDANRKYILQYTAMLPGNGMASNNTWSNLYTAPVLPFPDHYIVPDTRTGDQRFYRLKVSL